jgi:hypothetical protein
MNHFARAARLAPIAAIALASCATPSQPTQPVPTQSPDSGAPANTASIPTAPHRPAPPIGTREIFPHIRADLAARIIELDGVVPLDCHDPKTPRVYLEQMVCGPDSKEHESLVMTRAKPSHLHAALLAIGLTPGSPGSFKPDPDHNGPDHKNKLLSIPATGDAIRITITYTPPASSTGEAPKPIAAPITDWIVNADTNARFGANLDPDSGGFVFSGSRMATHQGREVYDADGAGTIIGLTSFGSEVVSWRETISPDSWIDEPVWICDLARVPKMGTPVIVRIEPANK